MAARPSRRRDSAISDRLYSVVARGGGVDQLRRGSASPPVSQHMSQLPELRVQDSQRKPDSAPRLQDHQDNQQPQPRDGLGHGADPHHTPPLHSHHSSSGGTLAVHPCRRHCLLSPSRLPGTLTSTTPGLHTFPSSVCCRHPPTIFDPCYLSV